MARYSDGTIYDSAENSGYSGSGTARSYAQFHGEDDEDEVLQRQLALMNAQDQQKRSYAMFAQDLQRGARDQDMRQGIYSSPEQMAMDEFGPMYESTPDPSGAGIDIQFGGEPQTEGPPAPMLRRTLKPDAQKQMEVFRKTGGQNGIPIDEFKERERFKAEQKLAVAQEINQLRVEAEQSRRPFDAAKAKAMILSRNPGGVDPVLIDELLNKFVNEQAAPVAAPAQPQATAAPQVAPAVSVAPQKKLRVKINGQVVEMTEQELAQARAQKAVR